MKLKFFRDSISDLDLNFKLINYFTLLISFLKSDAL